MSVFLRKHFDEVKRYRTPVPATRPEPLALSVGLLGSFGARTPQQPHTQRWIGRAELQTGCGHRHCQYVASGSTESTGPAEELGAPAEPSGGAEEDQAPGLRGASPARPATITDVAKAAFVSPSTASLALSGRKGVTDETRERVRAAARELKYRPNMTARNLRGGTLGPVGLVVDPGLIEDAQDVSRLFAHRLLLALNSGLADLGIPVTYIDPDATNVPAVSVIVVLGCPSLGEDLKSQLSDLPVLTAGFDADGEPIARANFRHDHDAYAAELVSHLCEQGATRLAILCEDIDVNYSRVGSAAILKAATEAGVHAEVVTCAIDPAVVEAATERAVRDGADAVFAMFPFPGAVLAGVAGAGKQVPDDVLVVDRAEGTIEAEVRPRMSSLSMESVGAAAIILAATERLLANGTPESATLPHRLIIRESSVRS